MKRLILFLTVLIIGVFAAAPRPAAAIPNWPPLLNCPDVNADGSVSMIDVAQVVLRFGTVVVQDDDSYYVPGEGYMLLYDVDGGGNVGATDIGTVVQSFGQLCPLVETQVAAATLATMKYQDPAVATADGYGAGTQYVQTMGIHRSKIDYSMIFNPENPIGLIYKEAPGGGTDELIGLWYVVPVPAVCTVLGVSGPCQPVDVAPVGFDGPEDSTDLNAVQRGWHTHPWLCIFPGGTVEENVPEGTCQSQGGLWFETYGWMVHLYNFIPNAAGRFLMWNFQNLP